MGMSGRLLRPRQNLHPDAASWASRVVANGGSVGSSLPAVNTFCKAIAAAGIRDRFYRLNLFCGASDASLNAVRTPLYRGPSLGGTQFGNTTDTNVNFVQGDYAETGASGGLNSSTATKYLDTGFATTSIPSLLSFHLSSGFKDVGPTAAERTFIGVFEGGQQRFFVLRRNVTSGTLAGFVGSFNGPSTTSADNSQHLLAVRTSSTLITLYNAGVSVGTDATAVSPLTSTYPFFVFARNDSGTAANYLIGRMRIYSIGSGLDATQAAALSAAVAAFNTALGRT